jgi:cytochrome c oxidase assembly protein subunit 15
MAVPDWPTTYGYNMFLFPISQWVGGIFYEHSHRLVASVVGLLVVGLTRWLGGSAARLPLAIVGLAEVGAGLLLLQMSPKWSGAGHFLAGIGGVVLLAAIVWVRNRPADKPLPALGWIAFVAVQFQGLLGGLRVVLFQDELGVFHATLAQLFFALTCVIALLTSRWWRERLPTRLAAAPGDSHPALKPALLLASALILTQLVLGAAMRHQHAGLAIPDFPLAYGELWPPMDAESVTRYNQQRMEVTSYHPITAFQIGLQMTHRILAATILAAVAACAWLARSRSASRKWMGSCTLVWLALILAQVLLGAATIWSNKAADVATAHVLVGALSLAFGVILCIIAMRESLAARKIVSLSTAPGSVPVPPFGSRPSTATSPE